MFPQLANTYSPSKNYPNSEWLASPKLDGVRCLYSPDRGLISRSQKTRYVGFDAIEEICLLTCRNNNLAFLDGELYIPGEKFDVISGIVRDSKKFDVNQKLRVEYRIFAAGSIAHPTASASTMLDLIKSALPETGRVTYVPHSITPNTPRAIQTVAELVKNSGLSDEGIMLRNPSSVYTDTGVRSNDLLKVKNFVKDSFVIVGFTKGTGKYAQSLGALLIRGLIGDRVVSAKVGTGLTDLQRSNVWTNQSNYLDKDIEVIYLGVTAAGSLRHPVFSRFI
ncbi:MAG: hypothetical protein EAZ73_09090 [Oscillatoriales cyanobacterium]|uniref:ATP-dependent DNA ligase n=1 Tax=unclassified Microcoleus TaxID=2642155 RepID=UPI001D6EB0EF|nr:MULTISPECIES: hypothetical protein [unclassified Microcoleus]TAF00868.1 MAG: hypothetical protein EAZ79_01505 [Oscillatoriales cyanobacterium]MCC3459793.1 hypothetical protein [Microcoleus sp. PH2017_11_PCY_U_A]MCC3478226.1 hypothetical protein [Microcoleus sp. PH2017_12_PCY_D_A]TAF21373.1 MAG: hypothetical protein EAZ73_09090 [Oscillatoriales cyanobacterium]TAF39700.1 MAG: hypothetical protein EAZ69_00255 [Oscillatoriales cyanobacterium]